MPQHHLEVQTLTAGSSSSFSSFSIGLLKLLYTGHRVTADPVDYDAAPRLAYQNALLIYGL